MSSEGIEPKMSIKVSYSTAIKLLQDQIDEGLALLGEQSVSEEAYSGWEMVTRNHLKKIFGEGSSEETRIFQDFAGVAFSSSATKEWWEAYRMKELASNVSRLESQVKSLTIYARIEDQATATKPIGDRVFLVHGHNESALYQVAHFLNGQHLEPIILQEEPNRGRTIIEKVEAQEDVGFAVVLLTGDDQGKAANAPPDALQPRARQNAIFELGYFIGRLGRARVCALYEDGVELPSDYSGVLYVAIDRNGGWKLKLGKELKAAGFEVDLNRMR